MKIITSIQLLRKAKNEHILSHILHFAQFPFRQISTKIRKNSQSNYDHFVPRTKEISIQISSIHRIARVYIKIRSRKNILRPIIILNALEGRAYRAYYRRASWRNSEEFAVYPRRGEISFRRFRGYPSSLLNVCRLLETNPWMHRKSSRFFELTHVP